VIKEKIPGECVLSRDFFIGSKGYVVFMIGVTCGRHNTLESVDFDEITLSKKQHKTPTDS